MTDQNEIDWAGLLDEADETIDEQAQAIATLTAELQELRLESKQSSLVERCAKIADAEFHAAARAQITSGPTDYNRGSKNTALIIRNEIRALQSIKG